MTINEENESIASPYLMNMIRKLDERKPGTSGYVTQVPELKGILSEITPLVSVGVYTHPNYNHEDTDTVPVEIKILHASFPLGNEGAYRTHMMRLVRTATE